MLRFSCLQTESSGRFSWIWLPTVTYLTAFELKHVVDTAPIPRNILEIMRKIEEAAQKDRAFGKENEEVHRP